MKLLTLFLVLCLSLSARAVDEVKGIPSRDPDIALPLLKKLVGQPEVKQVEAILGAHDRIVGSGRCILVFALRDGSEVWVNTEDCVHLGWITRRQNGKADETIFERFKKSN